MDTNRWVEVDVSVIGKNLQEIKKYISPTTKLLAVIKANAYGHGMLEIANFLNDQEVDMLGVSTLAEALELRNDGITMPILIMSPIEPENVFAVVKNNLTPMVFTKDVIEALANASPKSHKTKVHLKIDTGMGRYGVLPDDALEIAKFIKSFNNLHFEGIFSHFSNAQNNDLTHTQLQLNRFKEVIKILADANIYPEIKHLCNSAGLLILPEAQLDMVRIGNLLYGINPVKAKQKVIDVRTTWSLKAKITHIKSVDKGSYLGYGKGFKTSGRAQIAYIPVGKFDGFTGTKTPQVTNYSELLSQLIKMVIKFILAKNQPSILLKGKRCPVVGKIGMQFSMADVSGLKEEAKIGDVVELNASWLATKDSIPVFIKSSELSHVRDVI